MADRQTCIDCKALSPETDTNYTLISAQYGWRITRVTTSEGDLLIEWRCPACWKIHKAAVGAQTPASGVQAAQLGGAGAHPKPLGLLARVRAALAPSERPPPSAAGKRRR
jgi:hypothetical protein